MVKWVAVGLLVCGVWGGPARAGDATPGFQTMPPMSDRLWSIAAFEVGLSLVYEAAPIKPLVRSERGKDFTVEMSRDDEGREPVMGLITIDGSTRCLVEYNRVCVIAGHKLTVE